MSNLPSGFGSDTTDVAVKASGPPLRERSAICPGLKNGLAKCLEENWLDQ
jgi:hypothetical protein